MLAVELWNARFAAHSLEWLGAGWVLLLLWVRTLVRFYGRVAKSNFRFVDCALSPLGLPLFVCSALPQLVSASHSEAGKLEGANLQRVEAYRLLRTSNAGGVV